MPYALCLASALIGFAVAPVLAQPVTLNIVGGLGDAKQYTQYEQPFWQRRVAELTNGRVVASVHPFDRSGLPAAQMLQLMRLGVVPFGTAILSIAANDEPELNAVDLPALNPDIASLRSTVSLYRNHLVSLLRERYNIELLGIYTYPAQVIYCTKPFATLDDLRGLRVRTSSVGQSEMISGLGAVPRITAFADIVPTMVAGVVDCAITGTATGNAIGLSDITTHVHAMPISWGLSIFAANEAAWTALPPDLQATLRKGIEGLEQDIWKAAEHDTGGGLACDKGAADCTDGHRSKMTVVPMTMADDVRRKRLLSELILPRWIARCGPECAKSWNDLLADKFKIRLDVE